MKPDRVHNALAASWPPFRGLIFDVDGTLYRQLPVRIRMAARLLGYGLASPSQGVRTIRFLREYRRAQELLRSAGRAEEQLGVACRHVGVDPAWASVCVETWVDRKPLDFIAAAVYPDLSPFLERAGRAGLRLGVFSDYPAERKLAALGLSKLFSSVVSASDPRVGRFKPDPGGILAVISELKIRPSETLYIGDRPEIDAVAARSAGVHCAIIGKPTGGGPGWQGVADFASLGRRLGF